MVDSGVPRTGENVPNNIPPGVRQNSTGGRVRKKPTPRVELPPLASELSEADRVELTTSREALSERIVEINEVLQSARKPIRFRMPDMTASGPLVVEVIDPETNEVIRSIPSDRILQIKNQLEIMMGLVFDGEV